MRRFFCFAALIVVLIFACTEQTTETLPLPPDNSCDTNDNGTPKHDDVPYIYDNFDEYFKYQGYLNYAGAYGICEFTREAAIDILPAWEITRGAGVKVAIFDSDIQSEHQDLQNITVYNIKDGGNSSEVIPHTDNLSHGTSVSSVLASADNSVGIIGVAPECDFLFISDENQGFSNENIIRAFGYAKDWGARVISCSWGSYNNSAIIDNLFKECYDAGIVLVFAAGNDGYNMDIPQGIYRNINDESESPWVIGVSASGTNAVRRNDSNYGENIDIMAPGDRILAADLLGGYGGNKGLNFQNPDYVLTGGTSFAAPITAGVIALMIGANPSLGVEDIKKILYETATKIPVSGGGDYNSEGFSLKYAHGLINAGAAVRRAAGM